MNTEYKRVTWWSEGESEFLSEEEMKEIEEWAKSLEGESSPVSL